MKVPLKSVVPPSLGERWWIAVRTAPICRERMPLEAILSYPVPQNGAFGFFHMLQPVGDYGRMQILSRGSATVPEIRIVEFRSVAEGAVFADLPSEFNGRVQKYDAEIDTALFEVLPRLTESYLQSQCRPLARQYVDALELIAGPDLAPYYRSLNPEFFDWLEGRG